MIDRVLRILTTDTGKQFETKRNQPSRRTGDEHRNKFSNERTGP